MVFEAITHPKYTLNCTELPPAFYDWLFNVEVEKVRGGHMNVTGLGYTYCYVDPGFEGFMQISRKEQDSSLKTMRIYCRKSNP
ncbi:hypothetical protein TNCV_4983291 [Trichonephila clavipes]|nr:hypothetical protein TNCV_4983291 [Trichonephila clavipes]